MFYIVRVEMGRGRLMNNTSDLLEPSNQMLTTGCGTRGNRIFLTTRLRNPELSVQVPSSGRTPDLKYGQPLSILWVSEQVQTQVLGSTTFPDESGFLEWLPVQSDQLIVVGM